MNYIKSQSYYHCPSCFKTSLFYNINIYNKDTDENKTIINPSQCIQGTDNIECQYCGEISNKENWLSFTILP